MTRKVKDILNLVANSEHYSPDLFIRDNYSNLMCHSLKHAKRSGLICKKEKDLATKAIAKYLRKLCKRVGRPYIQRTTSLKEALCRNYLPSTFEDREAVYLDWSNRPKPWKGV